MKILVTGSAGFIGFHLVNSLLQRGDEVVGIDNLNDYYDVNLKYARLAQAGVYQETITYKKEIRSSLFENYIFVQLDITDEKGLSALFKKHKFDAVCNLAAQAGVRYSLINPSTYIDTNIKGFLNILECSRHTNMKNLVYASSSSVYGLNKKMPFNVKDNVDHPVSLYAASKKSNELMAHAYSHLFNIATTGLRFFTVYGPWGRPDMAGFLFAKAISEGKSIQIFNNGNMKRDFTYIDDIIAGVITVIDNPNYNGTESWSGLTPDPSCSKAPYRVFNIGRGNSIDLMSFINEIEGNLGTRAQKTYLPLQDGDVVCTWSDVKNLKKEFDYEPKVSVKEGVKRFTDWYKSYYLDRQDQHIAV
ncbi:NAD-dependent epimerase/dehydratase [Pseudopedobacter saltans DSM 12145]|uniref:NAD-dependent epimerase/dehydratase n=1 Tax=Pseudopedobacter saltans (strain ATCC 51119 / DSM 12145 / JCM 21818 / CCUG 39354 / LMG 10337 / NBRC 100064 / NCIMB 13643) TaxID=762903 RepID=F0S9P6_PSESL|nr:NAD-dependent epimerase [Pseudopedobacter saltans]ADY51402.1 NAD-dependent epimerase/dehydratase [Pseudopedobacter saltans DSM 12145]